MYNRYIPQSDGTYRRRPTAEPIRPAQPEPTIHEPEPAAQHSQTPPPSRPPSGSIGNFLRQILPKGFDTGDLIVVLLLLLMSADCQEDQNSALLTLALYLFL